MHGAIINRPNYVAGASFPVSSTGIKLDCLFDSWTLSPQFAAPLINMLPSDVVTTSNIRYDRTFSPSFHNDPQLLRIGPSAPSFHT